MRRHVIAWGLSFIGKEADRWEEQFFLGSNADAMVTYGAARLSREALAVKLLAAKEAVGERHLATRLGIARETLRSMIKNGSGFGSDQLWSSVECRLTDFWAEKAFEQELRDSAMVVLTSWVERNGSKAVAERLGMDPSKAIAILRGGRRLPEPLLARVLSGGGCRWISAIIMLLDFERSKLHPSLPLRLIYETFTPNLCLSKHRCATRGKRRAAH